MKRLFLKTIIFSLLLFLISPSVKAHDDLSGHYFENDLRALIQKGIIIGYQDGSYQPNRHVTRAEFTTLLIRALNLPRSASSISFYDVKDKAWYYIDIATAANHHLIGGYPDGSFKPNRYISRQEMAAMIMRALDLKGVHAEKAPLNFIDKNSINPIYHASIQKLLYLRIVAGKKDRNGNYYYAPLNKTTRGETAAMINRMLQTIEPKKADNITYTHYDIDFNRMIDIQMTKTPKVDGAGIYLASRSLVEYYANPHNFPKGSNEFLQFLILSQPANLNINEINRKILVNKGALSGKGKAFVEAGKLHQVNEIYLIAHALHETGNGSSKLANGVPVDAYGNIVDSSKAVHTVYNMFGYGAVDHNPLQGGATYAFQKKWFTPESAIIGGAEVIASGYIKRGQDTLYKMRWNPKSPGYPQYATHVAWATLQTNRMRNLYNLLDTYVLNIDIPTFNKQPNAKPRPVGEAQYDVDKRLAGEKGMTLSRLNLRTGPTTSFKIIKTLDKGTRLTLIGENGGWYKVNVDNLTGWVSRSYVLLDKHKITQFNTMIPNESVQDNRDDVLPNNNKEKDEPNHETQLPNESSIEELPKGLIGRINGNNVYLNKEPNHHSSNQDKNVLPVDTDIHLLKKTDNWYFISTGDQTGWVNKADIEVINLFELADSEVEIRKTPDLDGEIIGVINEQYLIGVTDSEDQLIQEGSWIYIYFADGYAWIHEDFIKINAS